MSRLTFKEWFVGVGKPAYYRAEFGPLNYEVGLHGNGRKWEAEMPPVSAATSSVMEKLRERFAE